MACKRKHTNIFNALATNEALDAKHCVLGIVDRGIHGRLTDEAIVRREGYDRGRGAVALARRRGQEVQQGGALEITIILLQLHKSTSTNIAMGAFARRHATAVDQGRAVCQSLINQEKTKRRAPGHLQ